jgi:hypothetical protein
MLSSPSNGSMLPTHQREALRFGLTSLWMLGALLFVGPSAHISGVFVALYLIYTYALLNLWGCILRPGVQPIQFMFWVFNVNFLLFPALVQVSYRSFYWSSYDHYSKEMLLLACLVIAVGVAAFHMGALVAFSRRLRLWGGSSWKSLAAGTDISTNQTILLFIAVIGLLALVLVFGANFFLVVRTDVASQVESLIAYGLLVSLPRAIAFGVLLVSLVVLIQRMREKRHLSAGFMVLFVVIVLLNLIINYPLTVPRFWMLGFLLAVVFIVFPPRHLISKFVLYLAMSCSQLTLFPLYSQVSRGGGWSGLDLRDLRGYMLHGDFDGFQSVLNVLHYVEQSGLQWGSSLLSVILFFVPRSLWSEKREPLGVLAAQSQDYEFTNLSAPLYGELFVDFGLLSLVILMFAFGGFAVSMDRLHARDLRSGRMSLGFVLVGLLGGFLIIILRGSLLSIIAPIVALISSVIVFAMLAKWMPFIGRLNACGSSVR